VSHSFLYWYHLFSPQADVVLLDPISRTKRQTTSTKSTHVPAAGMSCQAQGSSPTCSPKGRCCRLDRGPVNEPLKGVQVRCRDTKNAVKDTMHEAEDKARSALDSLRDRLARMDQEMQPHNYVDDSLSRGRIPSNTEVNTLWLQRAGNLSLGVVSCCRALSGLAEAADIQPPHWGGGGGHYIFGFL